MLRRRFSRLAETVSFRDEPKLCARIAAYGIQREVGTANDELARFIFNADTGTAVRPESLRAEFVDWKGLFGVHIFSADAKRIELRTKGFYDVVHPRWSVNSDGTLHSLFVFPEIVAEIARGQDLDLVVVKPWGLNSIFGGFDPAKGYYQTNFWELENNDVVRFADLTRMRKIAFLGTHDLIAHIAGANRMPWDDLVKIAQRVFDVLSAYFHDVKTPSVSALLLPYTVGVVLDDLAQPPSYGSESHLAVLNLLLREVATGTIPPDLRSWLTRFPRSFQSIIELSRTSGAHADPEKIRAVISTLVQEILSASLTPTGRLDGGWRAPTDRFLDNARVRW